LLFAIPSIKSLFKIVYQAQHTNIAPILYQTICSSKQGQKKDKVLEEELKLSREMGPWRKRPGGDLKWLNLRLTRSSKIRAIVLMDDEVTK